MPLKLRKVDFVIHMDKLDNDGNLIQEVRIGEQPFTAFAYEVSNLPDLIGEAVAVVQAQDVAASEPEPEPLVKPTRSAATNRATRRAAAKR